MKAELIDLRKIWDEAPHNAFTDLIRFRGAWLCVFREGSDHRSPDGKIRILFSINGVAWSSKAVLSLPGSDLRDPKISTTPAGVLMINAAAAYDPSAPIRHQSLAWFSEDGNIWSDAQQIGDVNSWLWRVVWQGNIAYSVGYSTVEPLMVRLYSSSDGRVFNILADHLFAEDFPNEAAIVFNGDGAAVCILRRDAGKATAKLGLARAPYLDWSWKDLGVRIGGPQLLYLPDGRIIAAVRRYGKTPWTSLNWLDLMEGKLTEFLALPSGGDTSYAGLCWYEDMLWVSYYSSHERRTSIYLAKVKVHSS
jgi:hypothetical protein